MAHRKDGSERDRTTERSSPAPAEKAQSPTSVQNVESTNSPSNGENARDQSHTLKHNVQGEQAHRHPDTPAGQHATGSFTNEDKKS